MQSDGVTSGIANVTSTYKSLGIWNDTLMVLAADNGGHVGASGNNFPLRGEKSTNYEGGVREAAAGLGNAVLTPVT